MYGGFTFQLKKLYSNINVYKFKLYTFIFTCKNSGIHVLSACLQKNIDKESV